jgi:hypothetical protein
MPLDIGRVTHLLDQMHRSEDDAGDPIDAGFLLAADGARGQEWVDPATITGSTDAVDINIADGGGYFTATDVEAALQELAKKDIGYTAHGNTGSTETFDALTGWHSATRDATSTYTFTGATSGLVAAMVLELEAGTPGPYTVTWPGAVVWPGGTAPTLSDTPGDMDILTFFSRDGGTTWYGFVAGATGASVLDDLSDVTITTPADADRLRFDGSEWVNSTLTWEVMVDYTGLVMLDSAGNPSVHEVTY